MITSRTELRSARWVGVLFGLVVAFQRFGIPGVPNIGLLVFVVLLWMAAALVRGVIVMDRTRLAWWLAAAATSAFAILLQSSLVVGAEISVTAWILVIVVWLPFAARLVTRGIPAYLAMLGYVANIATALAAAALAMVGLQLAGVKYLDWFAAIVPQPLQLSGFNTVVPLAYGSDLVKANAWIGLEPSITSALIGIGLLAAFFIRARMWMVVVLIAGLIATVSGSGVVIVLVGGLVMVLHRSRRLLMRYLLLAAITVAASTFTQFGSLLVSRSTEYQSNDSSTSLRATLPYSLLFPKWIEQLPGMVFGYGPGSSQRVVTESNVLGLLVPSPAKIFFEYGLIAGFVLAAFILGCYWGGPSRSFALALLFSLWILQAGITTSVFVVPVLALVTLWSPRIGPPIESILPLPANSAPRPYWAHGSRQLERTG